MQRMPPPELNMEETPRERAQRDAESAIRFAHLAIELIQALAADMQKAGVLRPSTKNKMLDAIHSRGPTLLAGQFALERLTRQLETSSALDDELKRKRPGEA